MRIIFDGRLLRIYGLGMPGFKGGTETMVTRLAHGLAEHGHTVHVVTPDLEQEKQRGPNEWWWPPMAFPHNADAVVLVQGLQGLDADYQADHLVLACTTVDPWLGDSGELASGVDAIPVLSQYHLDALCSRNPGLERRRCYITGLGVDLPHESHLGAFTVPGRLLWTSEPARGLWHMLDIFDHLKREIPEATLHVTYNFDRQFSYHQWHATALSEALWACKQRLESTKGVVSLGGLATDELRQEQLECEVFAYPCDPVTPGSELFCLSAMEAAAAGVPLVLADNEALPEVFEDAATILPLPGKWLPATERRYDSQDWAEVIAELMRDPVKRQEQAEKARTLAERHSWDGVITKWEAMLEGLRQ